MDTLSSSSETSSPLELLTYITSSSMKFEMVVGKGMKLNSVAVVMVVDMALAQDNKLAKWIHQAAVS